MVNELVIILIVASALMMVGGMMGVLIWYFVFFQYKHFVELIHLHSGIEKVIVRKAKDFTLKDSGVKVWKLRWSKDTPYIPIPPDEVIKITNKGKNFVRVYVTETGDIIFSQTEHPKLIAHYTEKLKTIPDWIENVPDINQRQLLYDNWKKDQIQKIKKEAGDNYIIFKPYTTNHRIMQVSQIQKAEARKGKGFGDTVQMLINLLPVAILALVVIVGVIFWQDLAQPSIDKQSEITQQKEKELQQWKIIQEIHSDVQEIKSEVDESGIGEEPPY